MTQTSADAFFASGPRGSVKAPPPDDPEAIRRFEMDQAWEANRDQWGRPKVLLPDGSKEVGYRRASSYGAPLEDQTTLNDWKHRQQLRGIVRSPALQLEVTRAERDLDDPNPAVQRAAKRKFKDIHEAALQIVGSADKASIGTSLHDIFELLDQGKDPGFVPEQWRADVEAWKLLMQNFRTVSSERIVVQDHLRSGGKYDRALEVLRPLKVDHPDAPPNTWIEPGSVLLGDGKTAQSMDYAGPKFGVQCWVYASAEPYDPITKTRYSWGHERPRQDWAVILHAPSGSGIAELYWVDLQHYARAAEHARESYFWRGKQGKRGIARGLATPPFAPALATGGLMSLIDAVDPPSKEAFNALWAQHKSSWTKAHTARAEQRLAAAVEQVAS